MPLDTLASKYIRSHILVYIETHMILLLNTNIYTFSDRHTTIPSAYSWHISKWIIKRNFEHIIFKILSNEYNLTSVTWYSSYLEFLRYEVWENSVYTCAHCNAVNNLTVIPHRWIIRGTHKPESNWQASYNTNLKILYGRGLLHHLYFDWVSSGWQSVILSTYFCQGLVPVKSHFFRLLYVLNFGIAATWVFRFS